MRLQFSRIFFGLAGAFWYCVAQLLKYEEEPVWIHAADRFSFIGTLKAARVSIIELVEGVGICTNQCDDNLPEQTVACLRRSGTVLSSDHPLSSSRCDDSTAHIPNRCTMRL
jgi:hypothetical protein